MSLPRRFPLRLSRCSRVFAAAGLLLLGTASGADGQGATTLAAVRKIFVAPVPGDAGNAAQLRDRFIERLRHSGRFTLASDASSADAVAKLDGSIWVTGYVSSSPKAVATSRHPILRGYLSVELQGGNHEPLWSYLATPSRFAAGDLARDLADRAVTRLLFDLDRKSAASVATPSAADPAEVSLSMAGATFPAPLYLRWFELFQEQHPKLTVQYSAVGSETGIEMFLAGKTDFAASDIPLTDSRLGARTGKVAHFASVIGAVVPVYNLKGVDRTLNFTPEILAGIYLGKIRKWNDPSIRGVNRGAALPDAEIAVVHRSDGSGTTFVWTDYLSKVSPEWNAGPGRGSRIAWPTGTGAQGNEGVASAVQATPNSIGYVELVYALRNQLNFGAIRNAAGQFVAADLASVSAAGSGAAAMMEKDSRISITNAPGKAAYPVASFTWWLVPTDLASKEKRDAIRELTGWMLSSGQKQCSALGYVPLPKEVAESELKLLDSLK